MAGPTTLGEALTALGDRPDRPPPHPVQHGAAGTLLSLPLPTAAGTTWQGIWVASDGVRFLGPDVPTTELSRSFQLSGASAALADRLVTAARSYLERAESIDEELTATQVEGHNVAPAKLWKLQREVAALRSGIGRAVVVAAEVAGPSAEKFPGSAAALAAVTREIDRSRALAEAVHQSVSDLILLRNAEEANRIAESANQLSRTSNRIAELANISNIRMLGLTYLALALGLVSAVILFPNTGATILGMPSAAWVPGLWVDLILIVLAVVPFVAVFSRPWVLRILRELASDEGRASEGLRDLPEIAADPPGRAPRGPNNK